MLKNKEDDFLGDHITNNIKYADNEWQAQGTVDRGAVYTKESILHLLFEGFNYEKDSGDFVDYVARASTESVSKNSTGSVTSWVAAKLQHDLYLIDALYYTSTSVSCTKNIFNEGVFFEKGIGVANPVYDSNSNCRVIKLIDEEKIPNNLRVFDILKFVCPEYYTNEDFNKTDVHKLLTDNDLLLRLQNILNRYTKNLTQKVIQDYNNGLTKDLKELFTKEDLKAANIESSELTIGVLLLPLKTFLKKLDTRKILVDGVEKTVKDIFLEDFTLHLHDESTVKLPFNTRVASKIKSNEEGVIQQADYNNYYTRFLANSVSEQIHKTTNIQNSLTYKEFVNDNFEEAIFAALDASQALYAGRPTQKESIQTNKKFAEDILYNSSIYAKVYDKDKFGERTSVESYTRTIDNAESLIALYCPDVFTGIVNSNLPNGSWGIFYLNEENTENLFQDSDQTYKLYNKVLLGYNLADALISLRSPIGGFLYLEKNGKLGEDVIYTIPTDLKFEYRSTFNNFFSDYISSGLDYYPSISALNNIYKAARGEEITNSEMLEDHSYDFAPEIKEWLENECVIFKGPVYGDYVEELNFMQDLNPDSDVNFSRVRAKKTEIAYKRLQDSKYEIPYVEQTNPLINNTPDLKKKLGVYGSEALAGVGNLTGNDAKSSKNILPAFIYDYDKGDQEDEIATVVDSRQLSKNRDKQRITDQNGTIIAEERLISPTIDELWTFLKYLTESDGSGTDKDVNERLPKFFGIKRDSITEATLDVNEARANEIIKNRLNPLHTNPADSEAVLDILRWKPVTFAEDRVRYTSTHRPELQFGGYKVTRYIEKIYDYQVLPFSRRDVLDTSEYEYNTEVSTNLNTVTGYLEKLYNSAILNFALYNTKNPDGTKLQAIGNTITVNDSILKAEPLDAEFAKDPDNELLFSKSNDALLKLDGEPMHATSERQKAFKDLTRVLNYHLKNPNNPELEYEEILDEDGNVIGRKELSLHNHFKKYLEHPKNLKEIERDLETIRQNLQTLAEFMVATYTPLGYADRAKNRGTLHQLHKNAYDWLSTWLADVNDTYGVLQLEDAQDATDYNIDFKLKDLTDSLNNIKEILYKEKENFIKVEEADKKVVYDDGEYDKRYLLENYDHYVLDLDTEEEAHVRHRRPMLRPNETLLSEVYLAADGTWRSIHERTILPVLYSAH